MKKLVNILPMSMKKSKFIKFVNIGIVFYILLVIIFLISIPKLNANADRNYVNKCLSFNFSEDKCKEMMKPECFYDCREGKRRAKLEGKSLSIFSILGLKEKK